LETDVWLPELLGVEGERVVMGEGSFDIGEGGGDRKSAMDRLSPGW
jgi:hypothetical protein